MNEKSSENGILTYLKETYNETFEVEAFKEGSSIFKNMYGADKVIVHPKGKPEHVFLAGEDRDHEGEYYDNYVLSKWSDELTKRLKPEISNLLPKDAEYRVLLFVEDGKYDSSMKDMSVDDYLVNVNNEVSIELKAAVRSTGNPNVTDYNEPIFQLVQLVKQMHVKSSHVSVGFVDSGADISDYIRPQVLTIHLGQIWMRRFTQRLWLIKDLRSLTQIKLKNITKRSRSKSSPMLTAL